MTTEKVLRFLRAIYPKPIWRKRIIISAKLLVAAAAIAVLLSEIQAKSLQNALERIHWNSSNIYWLLLFCVLAIFNLLADTVLWKSISAANQRVSLKKAMFHHIRSITLAIVTPYNVGEFGGKLRQYAAPIEQLKAVYLTYVFRFVKMSARNLVGALALVYLVNIGVFPSIHTWQANALLIIALCIAIFYFNQEKIIPLISGMVVLGRKYFLPLARIMPNPWTKTFWLFLGFVKFFIYPAQFGIALILFDNNLQLEPGLMSMIWLYYSLAAFLPSVQLVDPIIKGGAGVFILSGWVDNPATILLATTLVWFVNVAIPAFVGSTLFVRVKKRR
ncbi:MAG: hypothetical protein JJU02_02860 [Cryomorphaceae bacterium]|nr:hypothetical protein [Cryomorphaceae bacterium]